MSQLEDAGISSPSGNSSLAISLYMVFWLRCVVQLPEVTTKSDERAVSLAKRLKAAGVEMYGAFWCNHCYDQKQAFGQEAMEEFPYVECYPDGYRKVSYHLA